MTPRQKILAALIPLLPCALFAQAPSIRSIRNYASGEARFSPGVLASLQYEPVNSVDAATVEVLVNGSPAAVSDDETGDSLTIRLPWDLAIGPAAVVLATATGRSAPFAITVDAYAPGIFPPTRSLTDYWMGLACNQPATAGETLSLFAVGIGAATTAGTAVRPTVTVGGTEATVVEFAETGFHAGLNRVRFVVPAGDGMRIVTLSIAGQKSNPAQLPVGKAMLNLATPSFRAGPAAPESLATAYSCNGSDLAAVERGQVLWGGVPDLPTALGGTTLKVRDATGTERLAPLAGATWNQVNYLIPAGTARGVATVTATSGGRFLAAADVEIDAVAPSLFWTAKIVRLRDGGETVEPMPESGVDFGPDTDQLSLLVYGTGIRNRSSLSNVRATIGAEDVMVEYAGAEGETPGVDRVKLRLPRSLAHIGAVELQLAVDGIAANAVPFNFK